jgi:hypothetical protein
LFKLEFLVKSDGGTRSIAVLAYSNMDGSRQGSPGLGGFSLGLAVPLTRVTRVVYLC